MLQHDSIDLLHVHRIYRDVRFSKDKTPYKTYFGLHLGRTKPMLRGGYYVNIEPGRSFVGGGFGSLIRKIYCVSARRSLWTIVNFVRL